MSDNAEKQADHTEQQEKQQLGMTEVRLFGEREHTHGAPGEDLGYLDLEQLRQFAKGQEHVIFFTDGHHLIQVMRPEEVAKIKIKPSPLREVAAGCSQLLCCLPPPTPPLAPPLAPGHYRLRFQCGNTETTVDWPEEHANAYHAKFATRAGYYWRYTRGKKTHQSCYSSSAKKEKPLSFYFEEDTFIYLVAPEPRASGR